MTSVMTSRLHTEDGYRGRVEVSAYSGSLVGSAVWL